MRRRLAVALLMLAAAPSAWAQSCNLRLNADIPIRYNEQSGALLIDAKVRGQAVPMVVSTSAAMTTLGRTTVDRLKLETRYESKYRGRGPNAGDIRYLRVTVPDFSLGDHALGSPEIFVTEGTSDGALAAIGHLGLNILYDYDIEFDVKGGRLNLYEPSPCAHAAPWGGEAQTVALNNTRYGQRVLFDVVLDGRKLRGELDSGTQRTFVTLPGLRRLGLSLDGPDMQAGPALLGADGKMTPTTMHRFESIAIEGEEIRNPRLPIIEIKTRPGLFPRDEVDVVLGADWVRAHRIYIGRGTHEMHFSYVGGPVFAK